ncbi:hypothetical protein [Runella salmonicolor]|uniref:Uncharacterized protein n=1 Tax=Runella salmonicolor TaxID=2950278 RepID=A0ABT1FX72_9BACT|nr:hypothetical protein [Runella salmonicolor]MCP1386257.1 hypothetical protein [Runella salmonicolor]
MNKQGWYLIGKIGLGVAVVLGLFWVMSLAVFLGLCLVLLGWMSFSDFRITNPDPNEQLQRERTQRHLHLGRLALVGVLSAFTLYQYWGAPTRIFKNADHHALTHLGYQFGQRLILADDRNPQQALWETKRGTLQAEQTTTGFALRGRQFYEPLYVRQNDDYRLANAPVEEIIDSSLSVTFKNGRQFTLQFTPKNDTEGTYSYRYTTPDSSYSPITLDFKRIIRTGIALSDLIARNPTPAPDFARLMALFDSTYLLREQYLTDKNDTKNNSPLRLFPSQFWVDSVVAVRIDGTPVALERDVRVDVSLQASQLFFVGLRTKRTKTYLLRSDGKQSALFFGFPERQYLRSSNDADQETLFITSSAGRVADHSLLAGLLFDGPKDENNHHHIAANMGYRTGHTTEKMRFRVVNEVQQLELTDEAVAQVVAAGDTLRLATVGSWGKPQTQVRWLMSVIDLKATNRLPWWAMVAFVLGFAWLAMVSVYVTPFSRVHPLLFKVEVMTYIVLLAFLTVRTVLLWRTVTFVPLEDITAVDFNKLRELYASFNKQVWFSLGFFGLLLAFKFTVLNWRYREKPFSWGWKWGAYLWFLGYGLVTFKGIAELERVASVFVPVFFYFVIEWVFQRRAARQYGFAAKSPEYRFISKLNWLVATASFAVGDAGFAIVFIVFTLIYGFVRSLVLPDLETQTPKNKWLKLVWPRRSIIIGLFLTVFISFSPELLSWVFRHWMAAMGLVLTLLGWLVWQERFLPKATRLLAIGGLAGVMALAFVFDDKVAEIVATKNRMLYRAEIRFRTADDIIADEQFNLGNDRRLLNAAQNQWFINYFYSKGHFNPYQYFQRVPHFQQGSSYLTQISDLVSVRYVIAEHSEVVLIELLFLLGILIFAAVRVQSPFQNPSQPPWWVFMIRSFVPFKYANKVEKNQVIVIEKTPLFSFTKLRVELLCFLFALAFTIWLTASDRMVFVGQDFPLLSMNSLLTLAMSFGVFLVVILLGYGRPLPKEESKDHFFDELGSYKFAFWPLKLVVFIGFISLVAYQRKAPNFDLAATVARLDNTFEGINQTFKDFQSEVMGTPYKNRNPLAVVEAFETYRQKEGIDLFGNSRFDLSVYEAFRTRYVQQNSSELLLHLRKNDDGLYEFAVNNYYYNVNSPDVYQQSWRGHLTASTVQKTLSITSLQNTRRTSGLDTADFVADYAQILGNKQLLKERENTNVRLSLLPAGWAKDSLPLLIVGRTVGEERQARSAFVVNNGVSLLQSKHTRHAIALRPGDLLHLQPLTVSNKKASITSLKIVQKEEGYLAKNVWLNGRPQHFYPLRERSLWSYFFTNMVKSSYKNQPEQRQRNVAVTLDPSLMRDVYDEVAAYFGQPNRNFNYKRGFSLVVMDNNGHIKALNDYKTDPKASLDPNRMADYGQMIEDLYLDPTQFADPARFNERQLFGNRCLIQMPNGPASTFKPILYGAVTSQYDLGWPQLRFGGISNYPTEPVGNKGDQKIKHFGGKVINLTVGADNLVNHSNLEYLSRSTNTYNSMIAYLGSFTASQLKDIHSSLQSGNESAFLAVGAHPTKPESNFPLLEYGGQKFRIKNMPNWDEKASLMSKGLTDNFGLAVNKKGVDDKQGLGNQNIAEGLSNETDKIPDLAAHIWCFPEPSHLYMADRTSMQNAIPQIAMGGYPIRATPLKMAQMAANLFSFNPLLKASVLTQPSETTKGRFVAGGNWQDEAQLLSFYSQNLFQGMHDAIEKGTAPFLKGLAPGYHLYAKTGTISGDRRNNESRDKNLLLVISKNALHGQPLTVEQVQQNKFYILYFSFYSDAAEGGWSTEAKTTIRKLIERVITSPGFKINM